MIIVFQCLPLFDFANQIFAVFGANYEIYELVVAGGLARYRSLLALNFSFRFGGMAKNLNVNYLISDDFAVVFREEAVRQMVS